MKRSIFFAYGVVSYLVFLATFLYAIAFVGGFGVPTQLDGNPREPIGRALAIDVGLLTLFAVQHSVMARRRFKEWWTQIVPWTIERSTYVMCASLALLFLFWQWRPTGIEVWSVQSPAARVVLRGLFAAGWSTVLIVTFLINHFDLFGLRQVWLPLVGQPYTKVSFRTPLPYRFVRHPLYVGFLLAFWMTPTMTVAHLLFASATTAYIVLAIQFEERDLVAEHGVAYEEYRRRVPMLVPGPRRPPPEAFIGLAVLVCAGGLVGLLTLDGHRATADERVPNLLAFDNDAGQARTFNVNGAIDLNNPFFQDLGTNGRRCVSCHQPANAWTITPANVQSRFASTDGADPIFSNNDGSNCEGVRPGSLKEKQAAYSLLLNRGLIRIGLNVPAGAEFVIDRVADPNQCAPATNDASLYRRPLPSSNVGFLSAIMWDGRESSSTRTIEQDLLHQANAATRGHAEGVLDLTAGEAQQIVAFEMGLFTAQARDRDAGNLRSQGAAGGPEALAKQPFFIGINDPVGLNPAGAAFDPKAFTLFVSWERLRSSDADPYTASRRAIGRGQAIFNTRPMTLTGVGGLNGQTFPNGVTLPETFGGTCTTCHDTPNAGNHSVKAPLNIGLTDPAIAPYLPVYTLRNLMTQDTIATTDPGRAMITGKWTDIGKFKGPVLRALAARAPYFHNGSAETLEDAIQFYEKRFNLGLTVREKADLLAFLRAL